MSHPARTKPQPLPKTRWQDAIRDDPEVMGSTLAVGMVLSTYWNAETGQCYVGRPRVCRDTGYGVSTVTQATRKLAELGYLKIHRRWNASSLYEFHLTKDREHLRSSDRRQLRSRNISHPSGGLTGNREPSTEALVPAGRPSREAARKGVTTAADRSSKDQQAAKHRSTESSKCATCGAADVRLDTYGECADCADF